MPSKEKVKSVLNPLKKGESFLTLCKKGQVFLIPLEKKVKSLMEFWPV